MVAVSLRQGVKPTVASASLHRRKPTYARLDLWPFVVAYVVIVWLWLQAPADVHVDPPLGASGVRGAAQAEAVETGLHVGIDNAGDDGVDAATRAAGRTLEEAPRGGGGDLSAGDAAGVAHPQGDAHADSVADVDANTDTEPMHDLNLYALALGIVVVLHGLALLSTVWSKPCKARAQYSPAASLADADAVLCVAREHCGEPAICPIRRMSDAAPGVRGTKATASSGTAKDLVSPIAVGGGGKYSGAGAGAGAGDVDDADGDEARAPPIVIRLPHTWFTFQKVRYGLVDPAADAGDADSGDGDGNGGDDSGTGRGGRSTSPEPHRTRAEVTFARIDYPDAEALTTYHASEGHSQPSARAAFAKWNANTFDIPIPTFAALFQEHAVAPFFVFQMFSVLLWLLDEYWHYAVFTLVMLVVFECLNVWQRLVNLRALRDMERPSQDVHVYRSGKWTEVPAADLVPGDVCSIVRSPLASRPKRETKAEKAYRVRRAQLKAQKRSLQLGLGSAQVKAAIEAAAQAPAPMEQVECVCPCDAVLLRGQAVVNEAMLTGESVPKLKESLPAATGGGEQQRLRAVEGTDRSDAKHCVFAGTRILSHVAHYAPAAAGGGGAGARSSGAGRAKGKTTRSGAASKAASAATVASVGAANVPPAPDRGCIAVVLRTGFSTSQGELMRTIRFATEKVSAGNMEALKFLLCLLVFAVCAAWYVLRKGLEDESRSRFKLFLHCTMIVTSVVPPELPMQLSMAVTASLQALTAEHIFCTEPYRIPFAGKIDVACYDKTGTLTSDKLIVRGVAGGGGDGDGDGDGDTSDRGASDLRDLMPMTPVHRCGPSTVTVLAGCHSLVSLSGQVAGDPMEKATLAAVGWTVGSDGTATPRRGGVSALLDAAGSSSAGSAKAQRITILHRFQFESALRRMTTVVSLAHSSNTVWALTKGAPETIERLLRVVPRGYRSTFYTMSLQGARVLALGYKPLGGVTQSAARTMPREEAESDLEFAGFLVLDCPLKPHTVQVLKDMRRAQHRTVMVTGDNPLTALSVAAKVGMLRHPRGSDAGKVVLAPLKPADLDPGDDGGDVDGGGVGSGSRAAAAAAPLALVWNHVGLDTGAGAAVDDRATAFTLEGVSAVAEANEMCVTGAALGALHAAATAAAAAGDAERVAAVREALRVLEKGASVFARVSPHQKEVLLSDLNRLGAMTMMCGDGTNDVGALTKAHVGISVINNPLIEERLQAEEEDAKAQKQQQGPGFLAAKAGASAGAGAGAGASGAESSGTPVTNALRRRINAGTRSGASRRRTTEPGPAAAGPRSSGSATAVHAEDILQQGLAGERSAVAQFGDASIASPFTSKLPTVMCTVALVRQGRCALVTTLQMYKILAVNCLLVSYMLSVLYLNGVKTGESQQLVVAMFVAFMFLALSRAKPLKALSRQRPPSSVFAPPILISIVGQFVTHLAVLTVGVELCRPHMATNIDPDGDFTPNVINSVVFLLTTGMNACVFGANYWGRPFMESLAENKLLLYLLAANFALALIASSELVWPLNDFLELVEMPTAELRHAVTALMVVDAAVVFGWDAAIRWAYSEQE